MKNRIISLILVFTTLFSAFAFTVSAASGEEYLSEVALVYEDSVEDAKKAIEGTDWKLYEQDLNPNADYAIDDGVYLIYKTSTNVEDAITDLRVMDMYGGFSISNYQKQLEASRKEYLKMVSYIRTAASEFAALYRAGDEMAKLAYRQMNYYKDSDTKKLMGDFFLDIPSDNALVTVMMEGNSIIVTNLISLLAIGISGEDENTLASKVAVLYEIRDTLTDTEYYDAAVKLSESLIELRAKLIRYDELSEQYDLTDENMSEEEFLFMSENAALAVLLEEITLGEKNLADIIRGIEYEVEDLYPIVAALSEGQKALIEMGQLETVLKYNAPSKPISELNTLLDNMEAEMKGADGAIVYCDVYEGVDRSIFKGTFAMTNAADRQQALTGETWGIVDAVEFSKGVKIACISLAAVDAAALLVAAGIGIKYDMLALESVAAKSVDSLMARITADGAKEAFAKAWFPTAKGLLITAAAVALIIVGVVSIATWYNYYNPNYTEIPNTMVDVRETDLGDKYIKYTAAKVYGVEEDMNADFNAYEGKEWVALYYTKDATAGNCLLAKFVCKNDDSSVARRHQGISMFGETNAYNLNSHVYSKNAPGVYVTMRYSTAKKAAAEVPSVVGSIFAAGALYALTALGGAGIGVGTVLTIENLNKKKKSDENGETAE